MDELKEKKAVNLSEQPNKDYFFFRAVTSQPSLIEFMMNSKYYKTSIPGQLDVHPYFGAYVCKVATHHRETLTSSSMRRELESGSTIDTMPSTYSTTVPYTPPAEPSGSGIMDTKADAFIQSLYTGQSFNHEAFKKMIPNVQCRIIINDKLQKPTFLHALYDEFLKQGDSRIIGDVPDDNFEAEFKTGDFISALLDRARGTMTEQALPETDLFDFATREIIKSDGKRLTREGAPIPPGTISDDDCFGLGLTRMTKNECDKLLLIITSEDKEHFDRFIGENTGIFDQIPQNIEAFKNVDPRVAKGLLELFGVKIIDVFDTRTNKSIKKFESVDTWKSEHKDTQKIATYVKMLIRFVNENPAILNSGIGTQYVQSDYMQKLGVKPYPCNIPFANSIYESPTQHLLNNSRFFGQLRTNFTPLPFSGARQPFMFGGAQTGGAPVIASIIKGLVANLKAKGKKLSQHDLEQIEKHISQLEKLDETLQILAKYLYEYKNWTEIMRDTTPETYSIGLIQQNIEKYHQCVSKYSRIESGLLNVVDRISSEL